MQYRIKTVRKRNGDTRHWPQAKRWWLPFFVNLTDWAEHDLGNAETAIINHNKHRHVAVTITPKGE